MGIFSKKRYTVYWRNNNHFVKFDQQFRSVRSAISCVGLIMEDRASVDNFEVRDTESRLIIAINRNRDVR